MKQIYVQAQADHIESLFKASPMAAIEELIWNALDADAKEVQVDLILNELGAVSAIRVSDDGTGIDILKADSTFGSLGGSWKREVAATTPGKRRLHGRHGRGRFKAFALGSHVEWRTTMRAGGDLVSFTLSGDAERPGVFELEAATQGPGAGTEVYIENVRANCDSLLATVETVETLASKFALYLKSYPFVRIYFNGLPVTPVIVQRGETEYTVSTESGAEAKLRIIEWKRRFSGSGRLVWSGRDGFQLHEQSAMVRSGGAAFTAYLISDRFLELARENALIMDELNPEVRMYLDAAKRKLKEHFAEQNANKAESMVSGWIDDGIYPYDEDDGSEERRRFDKLAVQTAARFEDFASLGAGDKKVVFSLIKAAMKREG
jgi:hypothetical protein